MKDDKILDTDDFDMEGFPVDEAVEFYHKKAKKLKAGKFEAFDIDTFTGDNKDLLSTNDSGLLGIGDLGKKKKKGKTKSLVNETNIFKM